MRRRGGLAVLVLATVVAASLAAVAIAGVGKKVLGGRGFATNVTVSFTAPDGYTIDGGRYENWRGPDFSSLATGSTDLESGVHFDVHPDYTTRSITKGARNRVGTDMGGQPTRQVAAGPIDVPHVIRGKNVGIVKGYFIIRQVTNKGYEGWYEGGLAFTPGSGYPILGAVVDTTAPADDADKRIEDTLPSVWNRRIVEEGIRGIALEGNLAPAKLTTRVLGRRIVGKATDSLGHPVVAARVKLRKVGGKTCCAAATSTAGGFALNVPRSAGAGAFQLTVSTGGAKLTTSVRLG